MKRLILIIIALAGLNCYGQDMTIKVLNQLIDLCADQQDQIVYLNNKLNKLKKGVITFDNLFDYQQKCYNDSTLVKEEWIHVDPESHEVAPGVFEMPAIDIIQYIPAHYIHKKPTFEGFIEFIINK